MAQTAHGTLTAGQVTEVTVQVGWSGLEIVNRSMHGAIWVRFDGVDPTPAAADSYCVLGARSFSRRGTVTVRMVSTADLDYSVEAS